VLRGHASAIEQELRHVLARRDAGDELGLDEPERFARIERSAEPAFVPLAADVAPQLSLFGAPAGSTVAAGPPMIPPAAGVDAAVIGIPFDTATSFRSGARFGPEAIRSASALLRPYHPVLDVDVFGTLSIVDGGDIEITPGNALRTTEQIDAALRPALSAG